MCVKQRIDKSLQLSFGNKQNGAQVKVGNKQFSQFKFYYSFI